MLVTKFKAPPPRPPRKQTNVYSPRPQLSFPSLLDTIADSMFHLAIAKDGNVPIGTRMRAAGDMVSDKMDQHSHEV